MNCENEIECYLFITTITCTDKLACNIINNNYAVSVYQLKEKVNQ